jgi:acyl-CoA hydrolase
MLHRAATDRLKVRRPHLFCGTCTPPDADGFVSLSLGITYERDILEAAEITVLEVNDKLPRTLGDTLVHVSEVTHFVENHQTPPTLPAPQPDEVAIRIGRHIAELVDDGSTIQLGIGEIPNAVALSLTGKKDLGVHTEMMVDSMMELSEMGVINNSKKTLHPGKFICTFAMGSEKLYRWLDNNTDVEFLRGKYVNDPCAMKHNSRMVSINTCIMVDFTGQVSSESIGIEQYSGTGGQTDTAVAAIEGTDGLGKSIIACRSTARGGKVSTIVPVLPEGSAVTLHRSHTDWVVTEWGSVRLTGRTVRERTSMLISVAHPDFREELRRKAEEMGFV